MDSKGIKQAAHLAQIDEAPKLHALITDKVNAAFITPLVDDDLSFLKLKVEAMWKASQKHFETVLEQSSRNESAGGARVVGSTERAAKIKACELRNNATLTQKLLPSRGLWDMIAIGRQPQNNEFVYVPIEKVVCEWDQEGKTPVRKREPDGVDREVEQAKEDMPA